jgi:hypothetical protein
MFCASGLIFDDTEGAMSVFMFSAFGLVLVGTEGVGSSFHALRSRTRFRWYWGRRVSFSCFALSNSFSTVPRASGYVFMLCATGPVSGGTEGAESRFQVPHSQTPFRRYRRLRVAFSCFALLDPFWVVPGVSGIVFMFCFPGLISDSTEDVRSRLHVLRS